MNKLRRTELDTLLKCEDTNNFYQKLKERVIGQDEALAKSAEIIEAYKAGYNQKGKPLATVMYLGPSGSGKTFSIETLASCLFGSPKAFFKIDCGEFQASHTVSTLLGSPPGYAGYRNSDPYISQEKLNKYQTAEYPINILLLDEIEKSCDAIFQLLLGILDKATLTMHSGEVIDFSNTIIFMTSNLGSEGMLDANKEGLGFVGKQSAVKLDRQIKTIAIKALEKRFTPEFINRIDHNIVFNILTEDAIQKILDLELCEVQRRIFTSKSHIKFTFMCTDKLRESILKQGYSRKYGARELKRVINKHITNPLASLMMSGQLQFGDLVVISLSADSTVKYEKIDSETICDYEYEEWVDFKSQIAGLELEVSEEVNYDMLVAGAS